jgi:hypothetical protein
MMVRIGEINPNVDGGHPLVLVTCPIGNQASATCFATVPISTSNPGSGNYVCLTCLTQWNFVTLRNFVRMLAPEGNAHMYLTWYMYVYNLHTYIYICRYILHKYNYKMCIYIYVIIYTCIHM